MSRVTIARYSSLRDGTVINKDDAIKAIEGTCQGCVYSYGEWCRRDSREGNPSGFRKRYEITYSDKDFCGPGRRYFTANQPEKA